MAILLSSLGAMLTISTIESISSFTIMGVQFTIQSLSDIAKNYEYMDHLFKQCIQTIKEAQTSSEEIYHSERGVLLLKWVDDSIQLCKKYKRKSRIKKFIFHASDKDAFEYQTYQAHWQYNNLMLSSLINKEFHQYHDGMG